MRTFIAVLVLVGLPCLLSAQALTGIWRGYFNSDVSMLGDVSRNEIYKFEIQLLQENNALRGVSYSYKTTVFYGKAELTGIFTPGRKTLILNENKLTDLKISGASEACLMTCYLDYSTIGKLQFLEGTFHAVNIRTKADCGSGKIHLEKVKESEFKKEDFLLLGSNKKHSNNLPTIRQPKSSNFSPSTQKSSSLATAKVSPSNPGGSSISESNKAKPVHEEMEKSMGLSTSPHSHPDKNSITEQPLKKDVIPRVLVDRENNLVKTILTDKQELKIDLYDNGTIDNDTISIYHNNRLVAASQRLNFTPITFFIRSEPGETHHEIVVVAENLGDIPPNTALMVISSGGKDRTEIFLASNEKKNAKVIIEYQPKNK